MEGKLSITRHFFKVMLPGFQNKLNLPPAFCKKLKEEKSECAILNSRKGSWKIKICRNCEGVISLKDGWPQFVYHHSLSVGDFVVFEHNGGGFHFNVLVFDSTACEKEFLVGSKREHEDANEAVNPRYQPKWPTREVEKDSPASHQSKNPYFVMSIKPYHAYKSAQVTIPAEFIRSNNLGQMITSVTIRDPHGRVWHVKPSVQTTYSFRIRMTKGWHDFYVSNELKDGDVCVFDLNRRSLTSTSISFDVQIFPAHRSPALKF